MNIHVMDEQILTGREFAGRGGPREGSADPAAIEGVVLAGVHAWGNCILERVIARPLVPVVNRPLIWHILTWLRQAEVVKTNVCANSDTAVLHHSLRDGAALRVSLAYYEDIMPRGPAGCARDATVGSAAEAFVVVDGTIVPRVDLNALLEAHRRTDAVLTLVAGESGRGLEPLGIYVFSRAALEEVPAGGYQDIKEGLIPRLYRRGARVGVFVAPARCVQRVSDAASYLAVNKWAARALAAVAAEAGYTAIGEARVHRSARVDTSARIIGPVVIGPGCVIERDALLVGPTVLGPHCRVGRGAIVSRSVLWSCCTIGPEAFLDHSILTDESRAGAGARMTNAIHLPPAPSRRMLLNGTRQTDHRSNGVARAVEPTCPDGTGRAGDHTEAEPLVAAGAGDAAPPRWADRS